jgi:hypothetical protein
MTTPDTGAYLILGLVVTLSTFALYIASLWLRYRNLLQDEKTLQELDA